ncbi:PaaX family transcriptional regulator C-terminal domain-containing protein [Nocardia sp. R7R-8]|uniref:PaaX family transcriptional regulator C-terminal domain-containing protein n=1 Tax=Nocardia sp. R7R-8 TaxID=3459304 RepID=UPI00403E1F62
MQARSVVFDLFGGYIRDSGGEISLQNLIALLECFDVAADSGRVVMSRLAREGWFEVRRERRTSVYTPSAKGWDLLDEGLARIMHRPETEQWDGRWVVATFSVPEKERAVRTRLKTKLAWLGFGQLASSIWISPHDRFADAEEAFAAEPTARYDLFEARGRGPRSDAERAAASWDLDQLAADYHTFTARCHHIVDRSARLHGRDALVARTELVHDYRKFPFRDPGLPAELLPPQWPAGATFDAFIEAFEALRPEAMRFYLDIVGAEGDAATA